MNATYYIQILSREAVQELDPATIVEIRPSFQGDRYAEVITKVVDPPPPTPQGNPTMNLSTAIFLVNSGVRPVRVSYDPEWPKHNNPDAYFKTLDPSIQKDDMVVVPTNTRHGFTVCKVEEVDFRVNFDSTIEYKWIAGKVDKEAFERIKGQEATVLDRVGAAEENRKRKELSEALQLDSINLSDLDIVKGGAKTIPAPPTPAGRSDHDIPQAPPYDPAKSSGGTPTKETPF